MRWNYKIKITLFFIFLSFMLSACRKDMKSVPSISTNPVGNVTPASVVSGGRITDDGGSIVSDRGICWSQNQAPTIDNDHISQGGGDGNFNCNITSLLSNTTYYLRAYAVNNTGIAYGNEIDFKSDSFSNGLYYEGGKIFYIDSSGEHGLIAALSDYQSNVPWYPNLFMGALAMGNLLDEGKLNTARIVNELGEGEYAAFVCYNLSLNGYHDWYLPSFRELELMYEERAIIGGFGNECYWSSTQAKNLDETRLYWVAAKALNFLNGNTAVSQGKLDLYRVRPIRSF
jgi:hypothetical protein